VESCRFWIFFKIMRKRKKIHLKKEKGTSVDRRHNPTSKGQPEGKKKKRGKKRTRSGYKRKREKERSIQQEERR